MKTQTARVIFLWMACMALPVLSRAQESIGKVAFVKGSATVSRLSQPDKQSLNFNDPVYPMDTLETRKGELKVLLSDETVLALGENSKLLLTEYVYQPKNGKRDSVFDILKGSVRAVIQQTGKLTSKNEVKLQTPTAVAGIRGTDVGIQVRGSTSQFVCFEGAFEAYFKGAPEQTVLVQGGQVTEIKNAPPTPPAPVPPAVMQKFESQLEPPSPEEVAQQPGGETLNATSQDAMPPPPGDAPDAKPPPPPGAPQGEEGSGGQAEGEGDASGRAPGDERQLADGQQSGDGTDSSGPGGDTAGAPQNSRQGPSSGGRGGGPAPGGAFLPPPGGFASGPQGPGPGPGFFQPPPILPGGGTQTPTAAGPGGTGTTATTGPVTVPITFPEGARQ